MGIRYTAILSSVVIGAFLALGSVPASATDYTVSSASYTKTATLNATDIWDAHELTAQSGQHISYSVTVLSTGDCAQLFFSKGHDLTINAQYLVVYSQTNCVASYSNEFPVGSSDGTSFSILIATSQTHDVEYKVVINTTTPAIPDWLLGLVIVIVIVVVIALIKMMMSRRRAKAAQAIQPPMQPPTQPPVQPPPP